MASGDTGAAFKFFIYAQSAAGAYYVVECLLGKAPGTLAATIKTEDVANAEVVKGMLSAALGAV